MDEALRLAKRLMFDPGTHLGAAVAGWERPVPLLAIYMASLYTAWTGEPHPLMPTAHKSEMPDVERQLADMALENMNRR